MNDVILKNKINKINTEDNINLVIGDVKVLEFRKDRVWVYGKEVPVDKCTDKVLNAFVDFVTYLKYGKILPDSNLSGNQVYQLTKLKISPREMDVISLVCGGLSNGDIADRLNIKLGTIKSYLTIIYDKLNVSNRNKLITCVHNLDKVK